MAESLDVKPIEVMIPKDILEKIRSELMATPGELHISADTVQFLMVPLRHRWKGEATSIAIRELPEDFASEEMTGIVRDLATGLSEGEHVPISDEDIASLKERFGGTTSLAYWRAVREIVNQNRGGE